MPESAITGGRDVDGCTIYVGRAFHEGDLLPAKVVCPDKSVAYVCHNGEEHPKEDFEVSISSRATVYPFIKITRHPQMNSANNDE